MGASEARRNAPPTVFWTGRLSPTIRTLLNISNAVAWATGNARDTESMKHRMKLGYDKACSDHVTRYDELGEEHYGRIADSLLEAVDLHGRDVLEVGCGTGLMSIVALKQKPARIVCGDIAEHMLGICRKRLTSLGITDSEMVFTQLDAEELPFESGGFDAVISSMVLGLVPNQDRMISEMVRVLRSGGELAVATHGPAHYFEAIEAAFRAVPKRYVFGYRLEYWPREEAQIRAALDGNGLIDVSTRRITWEQSFDSGAAAYDFFASTSASWWFARFPRGQIEAISRRMRDRFQQEELKSITQDAVIARGRKP